MTDLEVLDWLTARLKKQVEVAKALGVEARVFANWKARGISAAMRPKVWSLANRYGARLPQKWLTGDDARDAA